MEDKENNFLNDRNLNQHFSNKFNHTAHVVDFYLLCTVLVHYTYQHHLIDHH